LIGFSFSIKETESSPMETRKRRENEN
jgi:hypothetical protein